MTRYTPDVLVSYIDGSQKVIEVKYQNEIDSNIELQHKLSVVKQEIETQKSMCFEVFTDEKINQIYLKNYVFLYKNAFLFENHCMSLFVINALQEQDRPISIKVFIGEISSSAIGHLKLLPYVWHEIFKNPSLIDMNEKITMSSLLNTRKIDG
jgi:hypothetical protein